MQCAYLINKLCIGFAIFHLQLFAISLNISRAMPLIYEYSEIVFFYLPRIPCFDFVNHNSLSSTVNFYYNRLLIIAFFFDFAYLCILCNFHLWVDSHNPPLGNFGLPNLNYSEIKYTYLHKLIFGPVRYSIKCAFLRVLSQLKPCAREVLAQPTENLAHTSQVRAYS